MNEVTTPNRGQVAPVENRAKPPSAILKPYLGAYVATRQLSDNIAKFLVVMMSMDHGQLSNISEGELGNVRGVLNKLPSDAEIKRLLHSLPIDGGTTRPEIASITAAFA